MERVARLLLAFFADGEREKEEEGRAVKLPSFQPKSQRVSSEGGLVRVGGIETRLMSDANRNSITVVGVVLYYCNTVV